jgi:hypothetical protein
MGCGDAGPWSAAGIGMLHDIGGETPTQVLVFAAAAKLRRSTHENDGAFERAAPGTPAPLA